MDRNTFQQTKEEIIRSAPPATRVLWNQLYLICGERLSIAGFHYQGAPGANELGIYRAGRIYLALNIVFGSINASNNIAQGSVTFYDEGNNANFNIANHATYYDTVGAAAYYMFNGVELSNIYFSRVVCGARVTWIKFTGYRIIY